MEQVGFFSNDSSEPCEALETQVFVKKLMGGPAGLEISPAGPNPGLGPGLRRMKALNRIDIPSHWRTLIKKPASKGTGPIVAILAPTGTPPADAGPKLAAAGVVAPEMAASDESFDCTFSPDTPPASLVDFSVAAIKAMGGLGITGEWQWTVRPKGAVPR
jgi:hypothetical protein